MSETLYAIDVYSLVYQVFHAIPPMTSPSGQATNAVFGFTRDLLTIIKQKKPTYLVCAIDLSGPGVREEIYEDYKANRDAMPDDLRPQIPVIVEVMEAFGIPVLSCEGWEADDVLATLSRQSNAAGIETAIVTSDKDARQLITPLVRLYNVRRDNYLDAAALMDDWGVRPDQVVDFQSLCGDSVDNVPGVPLVGPKKASFLLNQFGTLEEVLAHAEEAPGKKLRENLQTFAEQALMSRQLVELNQNLPIEIDWEDARVGGYDVEALVQIFRECGFRKFVDEVRALAPEDATPRDPLFADDGPHVEIVDSEAALDDVVSKLTGRTELALRIEAIGLNPVTSRVAALTIALDEESAVFIPLSPVTSETHLSPDVVWPKLKPLLQSSRPPGGEGTESARLVGHNLKTTLTLLRGAGIENVEPGLDSMVGFYLLEAGSRAHSLSHVVDRYFHQPIRPLSRLNLDEDSDAGSDADSKKKRSKNVPPLALSRDQFAKHAAEEACLMLRVGQKMRAELEEKELTPLYEDLERLLIPVLADLEVTGIKVDAEELGRQNEQVSKRLDELMTEIHEEAGEEFNIDSPKQLQEILFDRLELPVIKKTKTGASTDQDVLEQLAQIHPLPAKIIEHRHLAKLKGTYLDALPTMINPATGRIHCRFNQVVAATGRLSSSQPNLQNIPIRTPEGERVRRAFVPGEPDWVLLCADYSQIELRMVAHFSGDRALQRAFADGIDIHAAVAAEVFNVGCDQVDSTQRRIAKAVNFGVIYGQTPYGLAAALGISREEATEFIENYFERYSGVADFIETSLQESALNGFARTILGRRRAISGIRSRRGSTLNMAERTAVNTVIQGSAADLIKMAMVKIHRKLPNLGFPARMLLQIHDELVFETPAQHAETLSKFVRTEMESAMNLSVPITVDLATGPNWLDAKA
ncbi:MAG: DNA polymerase I [Planctomycetota bacterium]|nr:DNA polymerase I [Planctomycetota bacterium]MDA1250229.1 DNA polymerase I [Planctomycetota bacterium]